MLFCFLFDTSVIISIFCSYFCCIQPLVYLSVYLHKDTEWFLKVCSLVSALLYLSILSTCNYGRNSPWHLSHFSAITEEAYLRNILIFGRRLIQAINFFDQDRHSQYNLLPILWACSFCLICWTRQSIWKIVKQWFSVIKEPSKTDLSFKICPKQNYARYKRTSSIF